MTTKTDSVVTWNGNRYFGAKEIGFTDKGTFIVSLHTTPFVRDGDPRGSYFTTIPISDTAYRAKHKTKAAILRRGQKLVVYCDWGRPHEIGAPSDVLDAIEAEAAAHAIKAHPLQSPPTP